MSNNRDQTNVEILISQLKKLGIDPGDGDGKKVYGDETDIIGLRELPFSKEVFDLLSKDEKDALYIWLNRYNMPQS